MHPGARAAKRTSDLLLAGAAVLVLSPLMGLIALAVRISSRGPILFGQRRLGIEGRPFTLFKFRTMIANAPDLRNQDGSAFSSPTDSRVTRVGRILRASSLDELPQFFNVLKGDMSLVGPRPDQVDQLRFYTGRERRKLLVRPGITGLAQVSGRNAISWQQRKALDVEYVERQSFALDAWILLVTLPALFKTRTIHTQARNSS